MVQFNKEKVIAFLKNPKNRRYPANIKLFTDEFGFDSIEIEKLVRVHRTKKEFETEWTTHREVYFREFLNWFVTQLGLDVQTYWPSRPSCNSEMTRLIHVALKTINGTATK